MTNPASAAPQNLFGICARVGADFGFNPLWLRLAFASALILDPVAVIGAYVLLGAVVVISRLVFPTRRPAEVIAIGAGRRAPDEADWPIAA